MAKKKAEEKLNLDSILFKCRDILRQARNSGSFFEKRDMMLTLVFLRFIGEKFEDGVENLRKSLIEEGLDPDDEAIKAAFLDDPTFPDGTYPLPIEARWSTIINTPAPGLNVALDNALHSIATSSEQLKGCFVEGTFTGRSLAPNDIKKIVDEVNKISHKAFGEEKDLIGRVYEYFLKEFAVNATKEEGEFYTPHDAVQLIASMIEPFDGTLYDPCCGSGGMFIQSTDLVRSKKGDISRINVYGQEKEPATYRLAKMNLALRGISHHLGEESESTFVRDLHKGLYFNYIMANPPFNLKGWYDKNSKNSHWPDYPAPPESNANYAWILHILSHLKPMNGVAGFLLANGALGDSDTLAIRKKLIENDKVEAIVNVFFEENMSTRYLLSDGDLIHQMKVSLFNPDIPNPYAKEWCDRKHMYPIWKSYIEYNNFFSNLDLDQRKALWCLLFNGDSSNSQNLPPEANSAAYDNSILRKYGKDLNFTWIKPAGIKLKEMDVSNIYIVLSDNSVKRLKDVMSQAKVSEQYADESFFYLYSSIKMTPAEKLQLISSLKKEVKRER